MKESFDLIYKEELDFFIRNNVIAERVKNLKIDKDERIYNQPTYTFGHALGNFRHTKELDMRVKKVKNSQTLGDYVEHLYQVKRKENPDVLGNVGINREYKYKVVNNLINPTKSKLLCFAIAFELDTVETEKLLNKAGYTLNEENSIFDSIIGYFIEKGYYNGIDIDVCLDEYEQPTLFSVA